MDENELEVIEPFALWGEGRTPVYIVTREQRALLKDRAADAIVILDARASDDPDMQVWDSYRIKDPAARREIAQIMLDYNAANPVEQGWVRTIDSMLKEWRLHNALYALGLMRGRTADCDFNNNDEGKGILAFFMGWAGKLLRERKAARAAGTCGND